MNIDALRTELSSGHPDTGPYDADAGLATDQLNADNRSYYESVVSSELLAWSGENQRLKSIQAAAVAHANDDVMNIARVVDVMVRRDGTAFDANKPDRIVMLDALVAGAVLSAADKNSLLDLATKTQSRAIELGIGKVKPGHVQEARS